MKFHQQIERRHPAIANKLYSVMFALLFASVLSGCMTPSDRYNNYVNYINSCGHAYYFEHSRICVGARRFGSGDEQPGIVPVSAIVEGIVRNTTLDASQPNFDNIVAAIAKGLQTHGYAHVIMVYQRPYTFSGAFLNYPAQKKMVIETATAEGDRTKYIVNY
jgi:hypothetical protein